MKKMFKLKKRFITLAVVVTMLMASVVTLAANPYIVDWSSFLNYDQLDTGIYWFDANNQPYRDGAVDSPFDKTKPTIIYVHGWLEDMAQLEYASDFLFITDADEHIEVNTVKDWINDGYNVGVFNWCQLSDEDNVDNAEAKIWVHDHFDGYENINMRWKKSDGSIEATNIPTKSAAELFYDAYVQAMTGFEGDHIRIAGHSLGNQMAIRLTDLIDTHIDRGDIPPELMPDRVALLDPYYSAGGRSYLNGQSTDDAATAIANRLINENNVVFEMYKSSSLTDGSLSGSANEPLERLAYHVDQWPSYYSWYQQGEKHSLAASAYFWTKSFENQTNPFVHTSYMDNATVASMMGPAYYYEQTTGYHTINPTDDIYSSRVLDGGYVPQSDITLSVGGTTLSDYETVNVAAGQYVTIDAQVSPSNATSKIVAYEKVSGDLNAVQLCANGIVKGVNSGTVLIKVHSKSLDANGNISSSIEKYVQVAVGGSPGPVLPGNFNLLTPANGATDVAKTSTSFDWANSSAVDTYTIVVDNNSDFSSPEVSATGLTSSNYTSTVKLAENTTYYWKVTAINTDGSTDCNTVFSFTTEQAQVPVQLAQVEKPAWNGNTITWVDVNNESGYKIVLGYYYWWSYTEAVEVNADVTEYDLTTIINDITSQGYIIDKVTVQAIGDGINYLDGQVSVPSDRY